MVGCRWPGMATSRGAPGLGSAFYTGCIRLDNILSVKYYFVMPDERKPLTVQDAGRRGGKARAKKYPPEQLRKWAKLGGWPKGRPRKKKRQTERRGKP
jgi:hypothetical protein